MHHIKIVSVQTCIKVILDGSFAFDIYFETFNFLNTIDDFKPLNKCCSPKKRRVIMRQMKTRKTTT